MKHILIFLAFSISCVLCGAQATSLTVDNKVAGTLSQRILYDDKLTVENLTIQGSLNADDFAFIQELNNTYNLTGVIDLTNATIVSGGKCLVGTKYLATKDNTISISIFNTPNRIQKLIVPQSIDTWENVGQYNYNGGNPTDHYSQLNCDSLILKCPNLKSVGNGIGTPKYIYFGKGIETIQIYSYGLTYAGNRETNISKFDADLSLYLPSTVNKIYGHEYSGSPNVTIHSDILNPEAIKTSGEWFNTFLSKGVVFAPADTKEFYKNSIFKNLEIIAPVSAKYVSISQDRIQLNVGESSTLIATVLPENADNKSIIWKSSNPDIATVDSEGHVKALAKGECAITATTVDGGHTAECCVIVIQPVESISISPSELDLIVGEKVQLSVSVLPTNATDKSITWTSSNIDIATIDPDGKVTGIAKGQCTITVTSVDGGHTDECSVNVIQPVESVNITPNSLSLSAGESSSLSVSVLPANANDKTVTWLSEDENIARVDQLGNVAAIIGGKTKIYASSNYDGSIKDYCEVTVVQPVTGIVLNQKTAEIAVDGSLQLVATVLPDNSTNKNVTWGSSDVSVAMVSGNGMVYGIKLGQATIMATTEDGGFSALCKISVKEGFTPIAEIILDQTTIEGNIGDCYRLTASIFPENASNKTLVWQSDKENVASVDNDGLIRLLNSGVAMIKASATDGSGVCSECKVSVHSVPVSSIILSETTKEMEVGEEFQLIATIIPENATSKNVEWESTNESIATVDNQGVVKALKKGECVISVVAIDGSKITASCTVTIGMNSDIEDISVDNQESVTIYSVQGLLLYSGPYSERPYLKNGVYILKTQTCKCVKLIIKN